MMEIRWHGRGGQGAVTVSKVLASAALKCGKYAQAFPEYGPERSGAPVKAYNRFDDKPIVIHCGVYEPDRVAVLDETLLSTEDVTQGLSGEGSLVVNTKRSPEEIREATGYPGSIVCVDAEGIAEETGSRYANVPLLGALGSTLPFMSLEALEAALRKALSRMKPENIEKNVEALRRGYAETQTLEPDPKGLQHYEARRAQDGLPPYQKLPPGGVITPEVREYPETGGWRNERPDFREELCVNCLLCWAHCPEPAILTDHQTMTGFDYRYCKGCGICAAVCPTEAIVMVEERGEATGTPEPEDAKAPAKGGVGG